MSRSRPNEDTAFKNWFNRKSATALAEQVATGFPEFEQQSFVQLATRNLGALEFKNRVIQFSDALAKTLPRPMPKALSILEQSLPDPLVNCDSVTDGWMLWPVGQFIADYGVDHFEESMSAMIALTKRFSSEFAVRPFIERYPKETAARLLDLTADPNPHVRRWCSEGMRTRLPWGSRLPSLIENPKPVLRILERLKDDPELYVRRSVANNLNDLAKDHPELVVDLCRKWSKSASEERKWIVRHALRTLIKDGNPDALAIFGFGPPVGLRVSLQATPSSIRVGEGVRLTAVLKNESKKKQRILADYAVHFVRKQDRTSAKVFKWTTIELAPGEERKLGKTHPMKATTVRALYSGQHRVELQINGVRKADAEFALLA